MESSPAMTKQESFLLKKAKESIKKAKGSITFSDGQYQIAIPWKEDTEKAADGSSM